MTHLWEVVDVATKTQLTSSKSDPKAKYADDAAASLPTSPVTTATDHSVGINELKKSISTGATATAERKSSQSKLHFLEGFRSTLTRPRTKSDDFSGEDRDQLAQADVSRSPVAAVESQRTSNANGNNSLIRRWSESNTNKPVSVCELFSSYQWYFIGRNIIVHYYNSTVKE
jgi:hypothetical protein